MTRTLVLGGGFGGIAVATELRRCLGDDHEVVLVDRREHFSMGLRKLWELVGIATIADGRRSRAALAAAHGVRFVQTEVRAIDPGARAAVTGEGELDGDNLVVALGAEQRPDLVPGLAEHGHDVWDVAGVSGAGEALARFEGGRILVLIASAPYPCPPAPYECALLVEEHLRERGIRDRAELAVATLQPMLMPNAGQAGSALVAELLGERGIAFHTGRKVERVEPGRAVFADGELEFDLMLAVPPHRPPRVVADAGLVAESGWVAVDRGTLATAHPGVFAIGDVTIIKLANGLPLPKAGIMAELEGTRVARAIAASLVGEAEPAPFDGRGFCFMETGASTAALVHGDFFAEPEPRVELARPAREHAEAKRRFEAERLAAWFGDGAGHPDG